MIRDLKDNLFPIIALIIVVGLFSAGIYSIIMQNKAADERKYYSGPVIEKGYDPPSSGHKSHTDLTYFVIIMDKDINRAIRVDVDIPTYYNLKVGQVTGFNISAYGLRNYGNTNEIKHLK